MAIDLERQATAHRRLNVGCGRYPLPYWTNLDANPDMPADVRADALEHLARMPDASLDEIYAGHFLEHLTRCEARVFLADCWRVLVPGGRIGITVPDTDEVLRRYLAGSIDAIELPERVWWPVADLDAVCHIFLYSDIQPSPHRWAYSARTLARALALTGFERIAEGDRYRDPRIPQGAWYQLLMDGYKPGGTP